MRANQDSSPKILREKVDLTGFFSSDFTALSFSVMTFLHGYINFFKQLIFMFINP